jgi:glycosyltransferase involved in cell wall biosynthesis
MKTNILMPVFDGEDAVRATIESVLGQTFGDFTFVIVDDGSTDGTLRVLEDVAAADRRVRVVPLGRNGGIIRALNAGLEHLDANCDFLARIDCGDLCAPDRLEKQVGFLAANRDCAVVASRFEMFRTEGPLSDGILRFQRFTNALCAHDEIVANFTVMSPLHHPTLAFRRDVFAKVGPYDEAYPAAEDYELVGRILTRGLRVAKLPEVLVRCRFTPGRGISQTRRIQQVKTALEVKLRFVGANYLEDDARLRCVIWGSREFAGYLAEILAEGRHCLDPICFTDFDPDTWGRELSGLRVLPPDEAVAAPAPGDIVITMWNIDRDAIVEYLARRGWTRNRNLFVFS